MPTDEEQQVVEPEPNDPATPAEDADQQQEQPEQPSRERLALVKQWAAKVRFAKNHWESTFNQMRDDMRFAHGYQWPGDQGEKEERYKANIIQRHVSQRTATLYAKNPTFVHEKRDRVDYSEWNGDPKEIIQARQLMQKASQVGPQAMEMPEVQNAKRLLEDFEQGRKRDAMLTRIGRTLEVVLNYQVGQQTPPFKRRMKQLIRRTIVTGVGYVKLGYHRTFERQPEDVDRVTDVTEQVAMIERMMGQSTDEDVKQGLEAEKAELEAMVQSMTDQSETITREGLDFSFPQSTQIIVDPACRELSGFVGARWVAEEFLLTPNDIQEVYGVDVSQSFKAYSADDADPSGFLEGGDEHDKDQAKRESQKAAVWEVYDKKSGLVYVLCDGYSDFLQEPRQPQVKLERFWPIFVLTFNETEDDKDIFPTSDVSLMRQQQIEFNLSRQRLREHRDAARPRKVCAMGAFGENDKQIIQESNAHDLIELQGLQPGQRINDLLQPLPVNPIDPNLYDASTVFSDMMLVGGTQEAAMGSATGSATATESSIAESSRMTDTSSNVDDLDDFLTELAASGSDLLLQEMGSEQAKEIAGPGAVWPELSGADIAKDLWLKIRAGSSGRPNKEQEVQNIQRLAPYLMQIPGVDPQWMLEQLIERLDDKIDVNDAIAQGMPSIESMNRSGGEGDGDGAPTEQTGPGGEDPNDQGDEGADNSGSTDTSNNSGPNTEGRIGAASQDAPDGGNGPAPELKQPDLYGVPGA